MDRSIKAALLSALVFPGAGQFFLRRRLAGSLFALPALGALLLFISQVFERFYPIIDDIQVGRMAPDLLLIMERVHRVMDDGAAQLNGALWTMLALWLASTVHAFLAGRAAPPQASATERHTLH
jgi:hypothetical protein